VFKKQNFLYSLVLSCLLGPNILHGSLIPAPSKTRFCISIGSKSVTCGAKDQPLPLSGELNLSTCFGLHDENHNEFSKSIMDQLVNIKN
jgi:hypothetical protein